MSSKTLAQAVKPHREMKVLALGLPRTGTMSICDALTILGYKDVYHGIKSVSSNADWVSFSRASDASFPVLPTYTGKPFTREEWDELFGASEAVTDVAGIYAKPLIETYPEAKVILVIRDFDRWFKSIDDGLLKNLWGPIPEFLITYIEPLNGTCAGISVRKMLLGMFDSRTVEECRQNARKTYDRHHQQIQEMVPQENLLIYKMGEGWEPICEFLGKPVPDVEFPWSNEAAALKSMIAEKNVASMKAAVRILMPWVGGGIVLGVGVWVAAKSI